MPMMEEKAAAAGRPGREEEYVRVAVIANEFEAQLLQAALAEQKIAHYIKSFYDAAYDGLFQQNYGWGAVYAPAGCQQAVLAALDDIRREQPGFETDASDR